MTHQHGTGDPGDDVWGEEFWDQRYRSAPAVWSGQPNPQLVAQAADLAPGSALDIGCGEGADAIWLAARGWQVTAVDFSAVALERGSAHARAAGPDTAGRISWRHEDITGWGPPSEAFDLVSAQFMQLPDDQRIALHRRLATAVAPGGSLLVVGHHPGDLDTTAGRPGVRELFFTAADVAAVLDTDGWDVTVSEARSRTTRDPDGRPVTIQDAVLEAVRRR